jgi:hypothetical protein
MINGRTRWQGFERAWINLFENAPIGGGLAKVRTSGAPFIFCCLPLT